MMRTGRSDATTRRRRAAGLVLTAAAALSLGACSDRVLDVGAISYVIDGAPAEAPSPVRPMTGANPNYPNLASVPARPTDIPTLQQREQDMRALERTRAGNRDTARTVREDPRLPVQPTAVPPPVTLTPGQPSR